MTQDEQQQVNAVFEDSIKKALLGQRNDFAEKATYWFAQHEAARERIRQLEAQIQILMKRKNKNKDTQLKGL